MKEHPSKDRGMKISNTKRSKYYQDRKEKNKNDSECTCNMGNG